MLEIPRIRVLVVDDSIFFRKVLEQSLGRDKQIEIVGTAVDSFDAMNKIQSIKPDVVTLDVEMPKLNGIDFLKKLIPVHPVPVVVVSSLPINAFEALDAGAVDFVKKPEIKTPQDLSSFMGELTVKVKIAANARVGRVKLATILPKVCLTCEAADSNTVIAIGASTGGTEAILSVIKNLPETTPGIVVVQHMPAGFTNMYAQRLDKICRMRVKEAQNNDRVEKGRVLIAAGEYHLRLAKDARGYYVKSEQGPKVSGHCPSVDVLFQSVAATAGRNAIGIILTGMGADGAKGLLEMRRNGALTIGQDKDTCVVYGMPMVAYNIGGVAKQLSIDKIDDEIIRYLNAQKS